MQGAVVGLRLQTILRVDCRHLLSNVATLLYIEFVLLGVLWLEATLLLQNVGRVEALDVVQVKTHLLKGSILLR